MHRNFLERFESHSRNLFRYNYCVTRAKRKRFTNDFRKYNTPITELIFIGDEEKDRETAKNANCRFIYIDRTKENAGSISDLSELLKLL